MLIYYLSLLDADEDRQTFEKVYEQYKAVALRAAFRVTRDLALAEDAVHNGYLQIIKNWENFLQIPCDKRKSRIVIIVKNKAIDLLRQRRGIETQEIHYEDMPSNEVDMSVILEQKEDMEFIISCISKLPEIYKIVLELRFLHELSNIEIAETLGLNQNTVAMRILRAKAMLSEMIEKRNANEIV
jgi:RNA polymerase sigma-70 factor (ECF subfamily)